MAAGRETPSHASVEEALRRSALHARNSIAEASLATIALLDAIAIPLTGRPAAEADRDTGLAGRGLSTLARRLAELAQNVRRGDAPLPDELLAAILGALDSEIARWEERSSRDPEARAVLRAFLGLREILWEFGVRGSSTGSTRTASDADVTDDARDSAGKAPRSDGRTDSDEPRSPRRGFARGPARRPRVQRIEVED
jgi:hypothetical protein